ncbi:hypothetical protein F0562_018262 [Nyssa sinensis]|uniref:HMG box domain-containing protein n=1 Tax=Nyssa sinensis TaxID=561372 RepID=A0A5J4ZCH1_9ASTE|nr:hypothetical protein F0562_018262 [Nyssa sinensis]
MALKIKSTEGTKKVATKHGKPKSAKKPKTASKKPVKIGVKKPKKPPTASSTSWMIFARNFKNRIRMSSQCVMCIGKACGMKWKTMTYEEKVQYYDIAREKRAEFDRAMADYIKRMESGEDQESELSEFD